MDGNGWDEELGHYKLQIKWRLPDTGGDDEVVFYLRTDDAGDGNENDYVVWKNLRLEGAGQPPMKLSDLVALQSLIDEKRLKMLDLTTRYLEAASSVKTDSDISKISLLHDVDKEMLKVWLDYLAIHRTHGVKIKGHLTKKINTRDSVKGFGTGLGPTSFHSCKFVG